MRYEYKKLQIELEDEEVYYLWDLIAFALDYNAQKKCLTQEKEDFARKLLDITNEMR